MDLFSSIQPPKAPDLPKVEVEAKPIDSTEPKPPKGKKLKLEIDPKAAYDSIVFHLKSHDIPPFTPFKCKSAGPNDFKWFVEATRNPDTKETIDRLVVQIEIAIKGQNLDDPTAQYWMYVELYRRRLTHLDTPLGMGKAPRKTRKAKGSASKAYTEKGVGR